MTKERIVAVGLLTQAHLDLLGSSLETMFPVQDTPCFTKLIGAIDEADRKHWRAKDRNDALRRLREAERKPA